MPIFRGKEFVGNASDNKDSVRVVSRSHIPLLGTIWVIDDVTLVHRDRVLLVAQANSAHNGIYVWNSVTGKLLRSSDADTAYEVSSGMRVYVEEGATNAQTHWILTTPGVINLGITGLSFTRENRIGNYDHSGTHGTAAQTNVITLDESGQITNIIPTDIALDGGEF